MKLKTLFLSLFPCLALYGQGMLNTSSQIIFNGNVHVRIDGAANGNYTSSGTGIIKNNAGDGVFHIDGNWINNASNIGFLNDGITVELLGGNQSIMGNSTTFYNLTLGGTGTKTLDVNTTVGGISNKTGVLELRSLPLKLNTHRLTISNPSTGAITRTSGIIISEDAVNTGTVSNPAGGIASLATNPSIVTWEIGTSTGIYTIPFGVPTSLDNYIPIVLNKTSTTHSDVSASTRTTVSVINQPWADGVTNMWSDVLGLADASKETVIDRWYSVVPSGDITADLTLSYRGVENTTDYPNGTFAMQLWSGLWNQQQGSGPGVTTGAAGVTATGVEDFGTFILSSLDFYGPLPVELTDFSILCDEQLVNIHWTTASEHNSDYFILETSLDGKEWRPVTEIEATGNSNTVSHYNYTDNSNNLVYYRLRQIDINGEEVMFGPISANCKSQVTENTLSAFPNPTNGSFTVEIINHSDDEDAIIRLFDIQGRLIQERKEVLNNGVNQYIFNIQNLAKSTYTLRVLSDSNYKSLKVVKD